MVNNLRWLISMVKDNSYLVLFGSGVKWFVGLIIGFRLGLILLMDVVVVEMVVIRLRLKNDSVIVMILIVLR